MAGARERVRAWSWISLLCLLCLVSIAGSRAQAGAPPGDGEVEAEAEAEAEPETSASEAGQGPAVALAVPDDPERMSLIWRPASVVWPLPPAGAHGFAHLAARLDQRQSMADGQTPVASVRGPVEIDASQAVGVWIAALETVRVRQISQPGEEPVPLRFVRGVDGSAAVIEPGRAVAPGPGGERRWELHQPPSVGAVWSIEADAPTTVIIERVDERPARYVSVEVEYEVMRWITRDAHDEFPALLEPSQDMAGRLRLHKALADELARLAGDDRKLAEALTAWRALAAMAELDRLRPAVRPYFVRDRKRDRPIRLDDTRELLLDVDDSRDWRLAETPRSWTVRRKGPGQLRIAARSWAPADQPLALAELRVYAGGVLIERLPLSNRQAKRSLDPDTALPQLVPLTTADGDPVGEFASVNVVVPPGRHDIELELVGGPALLALEGAQRTEATLLSTRGWTPTKRARAAERGLAKLSREGPASAGERGLSNQLSRASERIWLELLLSRQLAKPLPITADDPDLGACLDELAARSPMLAVAALALIAADRRLDDARVLELAQRARPWLAALARDRSIDPDVRGWLRAWWLEIAAVHGGGEALLHALVERVEGGADPVVELPVAGLRTLAELFLPTALTVRSPALAVLELARARAPADASLRDQTLRLWTAASRWSRRRPVAPIAGLPLSPAGEWLVPREDMPADPDELLDSWLRLEVGRPVRVRATLGPDATRRELTDDLALAPSGTRLRLLDVHVTTPMGDPAPVMLRVDDQRWWNPMLFGVQRHRVAVTEGVHELELDGPPGTVAWSELPLADDVPAELGDLGRRERMWPLGVSVWPLPGPAVPGVVRIELRWPADIEPRPVRITMHEQGDHAPGSAPASRLIVFDPRTPAAAAPRAEDEPPFVGELMAIDPEATPVSGSAWASVRHDLLVPIAADTTAISFDVEDELEIAASLSVRRGLQPGDLGAQQHRPGSEPPPPDDFEHVFAGLSSLDGEGMLAELRGLSRLLLLTPDDLDNRARRAALLLMYGETGHARADVVRLAAWSESPSLTAERRERAADLMRALEDRFDALIEPREIVVAPSRSVEPRLVEPPIAAVVGADRVMLEPYLDMWAQLRDKSIDAALVDVELELLRLQDRRDASDEDVDTALLLQRLTRAELLSRDPVRVRDAGRAWLELYGQQTGRPGSLRDPIAVGLAAVEPMLQHLDDPSSDARDAGLAFGLARELEPGFGHTRVRRLAFIAALRSDWSTIDHSEHNSGFERLELPVTEIEPTPAARVREALMVAPWPRQEVEELRPGRKGVLAWDAVPGRVRAEFWCRVARPDMDPQHIDALDDPGGFGSAKLSLRLRADTGAEVDLTRTVEVPDASVVGIELPIDSKTRHRLEVVLDHDPVWLCWWRTQTFPVGDPSGEGQFVEARRRALWWTADASTELELIVLGPTSLQLESRVATLRDPDKQTSQLYVSVERIGPDPHEAERAALDVDGERERAVITESRRRFDVAHANAHTLLLTEAVPYRVRVRTDRGRAFLRARVRRDREDLPPPAQFSLKEIEPAAFSIAQDLVWRGGSLVHPIAARDEPEPIRNRIGSLDARLRMGLDDITETDAFEQRFGVLARVGWRRELVEDSIWLAAWGQAALRTRTAPAFGGILRLGAVVPVIGVRLAGELDVLAGSFLGRLAASMRLFGFVDRPISLGRHWQLRPGLTFGVRWQSLSRARVAMATGGLQPHPRVYLQYIEDHPLLLRPELELRAFVFQDMAVWLQGELMPNSDLRGLDHVNVELGVDGIGRIPGPWVPIWGGSYQASTRFADAHRSSTQLRHRVDLELGVGVWSRDIVRVAVGLANQLYLTQTLGAAGLDVRDVFELWLRIDGTWGRRLRDYGPGELWFREPWAPVGFADDEHQARSTQGERLRRR